VPSERLERRALVSRRIWLFGAAAVCLSGGVAVLPWRRYPSDRTPTGAYFRVVTAVNRADDQAVFPYLETAAQHAAFTIHNYFLQSQARIQQAYPEALRAAALARLPALENVEAGPGVFAWYAHKLGWIDRLRQDLSGIRQVIEEGDRATVETVRGTRYAFRKRDNGMWGLTLFTARLVADAEKMARDYAVIDAAARDYEYSSRTAPGATGSVPLP
jgi:hypothetical protein